MRTYLCMKQKSMGGERGREKGHAQLKCVLKGVTMGDKEDVKNAGDLPCDFREVT